MNILEKEVLSTLYNNPYTNQRALSELCGYSLGTINKCIKSLYEKGYLDFQKNMTEKSKKIFDDSRPHNAIILAAGYGMRMVPINTEVPKGLLEIHGEVLIERIIKQLQEVGLTRIYIVVGFMKENYEYLIDQYNVELIVNPEYVSKNNLHSLKKVTEHLKNSYVIPCDIWCEENPFHKNELYSWYMVSDAMTKESNVRVNRKMELVIVPEQSEGNAMMGISYLHDQDAAIVKEKVEVMCQNTHYDNAFWEEALLISGKMIVAARMVSSKKYVEINTYEQLRELDSESNQLNSQAITLAAYALNARKSELRNITVLKKGMTNRSFLFSCRDKRYIMRIPGEGTELLINRTEEAAVYYALKDMEICDDIIYINEKNGYKITEYMEGARVCDPFSETDLKRCMKKLREFHDLKLKVAHEFDIFYQIDFYESLWKENKSVYRDYFETKRRIFSLKEYLDTQPMEKVLTHIDAVPDNFLFYKNGDGEEMIRLIDWEYAGMQDPHVDIAMFCIYSLYDRFYVDRLIDIYFLGQCPQEIRVKIYCYIAVCGLLWSNWCEYKKSLGIEFGEYSLRQYRYAKEYYKIVTQELQGELRDV